MVRAMWPGFDSQTPRHMWVEFVVGPGEGGGCTPICELYRYVPL